MNKYILIGLLLLCSCNKSKDSSNPLPPIVPDEVISDFSGYWIGSYSTNLVESAGISAYLEQSLADFVRGTIHFKEGSGSVSGTAGDKTITLGVTTRFSGCSGEFELTGSLNQDETILTFDIVGSDCLGTHVGSGYIGR